MSSATALAVTRQDHPSDPPEQEIAAVERVGDRLVLTLDDGVSLTFNADEIAHVAARSLHARSKAA